MLEKRIYLYQCLEEYRSLYQDIVNPEEICKHFQIIILKEDTRELFFDKENAYFIVDNDQKTCIVLDNSMKISVQNEIIIYSVFKILLLRKFTEERKNVQSIYKDTCIECFYEKEDYILGKENLNSICLELTLEALIPIQKLPYRLIEILNHNKVKMLAENFQVRYELVEKRCNDLKKVFHSKTIPAKFHIQNYLS